MFFPLEFLNIYEMILLIYLHTCLKDLDPILWLLALLLVGMWMVDLCHNWNCNGNWCCSMKISVSDVKTSQKKIDTKNHVFKFQNHLNSGDKLMNDKKFPDKTLRRRGGRLLFQIGFQNIFNFFFLKSALIFVYDLYI